MEYENSSQGQRQRSVLKKNFQSPVGFTVAKLICLSTALVCDQVTSSLSFRTDTANLLRQRS